MHRSPIRPLTTALAFALLAGGTVFYTGCDRSDSGIPSASTGNQPAATAAALPAGLIVTERPAGAKEVTEVKKAAKPGDEIVLHALVGGTVSPLADNRAVLNVIDVSAETCDKRPDDPCKTPWDACCVAKETRAAQMATVQVVGADGHPLKVGLTGAGGLAPNKKVVVAGKVKTADGNALIVDAAKIYVAP
jgi:hypothetical protein